MSTNPKKRRLKILPPQANMSDNKSLFGKAFSSLKKAFSNPEEEEQKKETVSKYMPEQKAPLDVQFAKSFTDLNGIFLYCQDEEELLLNLKGVCIESNIKNILAFDPEIKSKVERASVLCTDNESETDIDAFISPCEYLIAFNGGIMISSYQTNARALEKLPNMHIVVGYTSQIVRNLGEGMSNINKKYKNDDKISSITNLTGLMKNSTNTSPLKEYKQVILLLLENEVSI
jgi:L-lactate dehydrogenase complex protein LldG